MNDEVEVVSDGEGAVVFGATGAVQRFLEENGLALAAENFELDRLRTTFTTSSGLFKSASAIAEQSGKYLKLTPESAKRLKDAGCLMPTKRKGVSHIMLGKTGDASLKWLQADTSASSLITNPALLSGLSGLMSQFAQEREAQAMRELLLSIDGKLDDLRRGQRNRVIAKMQTAAAQVEEARTLRQSGGDPQTLWDKVQGAHSEIVNVQEETLLALGSLTEKTEAQKKLGDVKKTVRSIEQEVMVHLAVLARCFELEDEFRVIELDHVVAMAPVHLEGHRQGLMESRENRRSKVLGKTRLLMNQLDRVGAIANENVLLHPVAARAVIDALNSTAETIEEFHAPLGVDVERDEMEVLPWRDALRDPNKRMTAAKEAGGKAAAVGTTAAAAAVAVVRVVKKLR